MTNQENEDDFWESTMVSLTAGGILLVYAVLGGWLLFELLAWMLDRGGVA